jgi:hypothetical protein
MYQEFFNFSLKAGWWEIIFIYIPASFLKLFSEGVVPLILRNILQDIRKRYDPRLLY